MCYLPPTTMTLANRMRTYSQAHTYTQIHSGCDRLEKRSNCENHINTQTHTHWSVYMLSLLNGSLIKKLPKIRSEKVNAIEFSPSAHSYTCTKTHIHTTHVVDRYISVTGVVKNTISRTFDLPMSIKLLGSVVFHPVDRHFSAINLSWGSCTQNNLHYQQRCQLN